MKKNNDNKNYYIFEPIKTTLDKILDFDKINLYNDPNLINFFIFKIYYIILKLSKIKKYVPNLTIYNCYITDDIRLFTEYFIDDYNIISINKNNDDNNFKLHHYNHNLKLQFIELQNSNNNQDYLDSFKSFINSLYNKCNDSNILNYSRYNDFDENYKKFSFLKDIYDHINTNNNNNFNNYINWFKFCNNYYNYKTNYYNAIKEY
jgi:hypothetical protein